MSQAGDNILVRELPKNASETLRVQLTSYNGRRLVDVRAFTKYASTGEVGPTRKGVTIRLDQIPALREALDAAEAQARFLGWTAESAASAVGERRA